MIRPLWWEEGCAALTRSDRKMAALIARYPGAYLTTHNAPFLTLSRAIVGQQISTKAADAVWGRLKALGEINNPEAVLALEDNELRAAGLSARKVVYIKHLAQHFADRRIDVDHFVSLSDEVIIAQLTAVHGIGCWTAQMFLIFNLMRPDVWPISDIGLQKALALHYLNGERPRAAQLQELGGRWAPWRTIASWYLWRSLDHTEVLY